MAWRRWTTSMTIALAALVVLAACGRGESSSSSTTAVPTAPTAAPTAGSTPGPTTGPTVATTVPAPVTTTTPPRCPAPTVTVADAGQLQQALDGAAPGDSIALAPGRYPGRFTVRTAGDPDRPIHLCGERDAVLEGGDTRTGVTLSLDGADAWQLVGFTIRGGQKGIMALRSSHLLIEDLLVEHIGDEAIHLRAFSSDNVLRGNTIRDTGLFEPQYGEGIYIGTATTQWCQHSRCQPDRSDRNLIEGNDISGTTSEAIDAKEGTTAGVARNNRFDGSKMIGTYSWVEAKGNDWTFEANEGVNARKDGFQVVRAVDGWGTGNAFRANVADVNGAGYGFFTRQLPGTVIGCDNIVRNAARGVADVPCTG